MTKHELEASDWIERLAGALDALAQFATASRINMPTLTNGQYRALAEAANRDADVHLLFEEYIPKLGSDPAATIGILQEHPVIQRESEAYADKSAIMLLMPPGGATRVELDRLAWWLTRTAVQKGGRYAAAILEQYLELSEGKTLPGYEITLFRGLGVDRRFEIAKGAFIAPYAEVAEQGLLRERREVPWENPPDYRQMKVAAIVRDLTWGPGIKPPISSKTPIGESIPDMSFPCLGDRESLGVIFDFLSILTRSQLDILSIQYRGVDFMEEIEPNFRTGSTTALVEANMMRPFWTTAKSLEPEDADTIRNLLLDWSGGDGITRRALRRLASSVARAGRFSLEDSILDLSIALEMIYSIDNEMTYKLGTRAGYFLGCDAEERNRIFGVVKQLYDRRSDIVHGRRTNIEELKQTSSEGFEVARDSLFKLLNTDITGDRHQFWNRLVMTGGVQLQEAETDSP